MPATTRPAGTFPPLARWVIWAGCVVVWTVGLLRPEPITAGEATLPSAAAFPLAKGLHVGVYAGLTMLAAWLGVRGPRRWLLVVFLVLHGSLTEYLQGMVPLRTGSLRDVALDGIGVLLGVVLTWSQWQPQRREKAAVNPPPQPCPSFRSAPIQRESA